MPENNHSQSSSLLITKLPNLFFAISGFANTLCGLTVQAFVCEITPPHLRTVTASFYLIAFSSGFSFMFLLGAVVPWRLALIPPIIVAKIATCLIWKIHDSPIR